MTTLRLLLISLLVGVLQAVAPTRYDMIVVDKYKIKPKFVNWSESALNSCDCRRRCVADTHCTAATTQRQSKGGLLCLYSNSDAPAAVLQRGSSAHASVFKQRKPKVFYWSEDTTTENSYDVHQQLCASGSGWPGTILCWNDYVFVRDHLVGCESLVGDPLGGLVHPAGDRGNQRYPRLEVLPLDGAVAGTGKRQPAVSFLPVGRLVPPVLQDQAKRW